MQTTEQLPARLLTVEQAAAYLGATLWCMRRIILRKEVPVVQVGKRQNVAREDLDTWVAAHKRVKG
jgi:excisionase family DNA binding protein